MKKTMNIQYIEKDRVVIILTDGEDPITYHVAEDFDFERYKRLVTKICEDNEIYIESFESTDEEV